MSVPSENSTASGAGALSIALIGPDQQRRKVVASALAGCQARVARDPKRSGGAAGSSSPAGVKGQPSFSSVVVREFSSYPVDLKDLPRMLEQNFDIVIVDLDSDPEYALGLVENICAASAATVMVYAEKADLQIAVRVMRAGAREFLTFPLSPDDLDGALARVSIRRPATHLAEKTTGSLSVFLGVKGGSGVTTLAANFALLVAQESGQSTLLIDFGLPLGDVAINLGMTAEYSTANALQDYTRLDANFLSGLLAKHSSGLYLLAAPSEFNQSKAISTDAVDRLIAVARQNYDHVIVDAGSRLDFKGSALLDDSATLYLVTQVGVSELRNANRLISQFFSNRGRKLQIVLNRYVPGALGLDEKNIAKALTKPVQWRIPDDYADARRTQNTATPIALGDSPISQAIRHMARTACGLPDLQKKKRRFSFLS